MNNPASFVLSNLRTFGRGRVVLEHTTGPLSGVYRIMGTVTDAPDPLPEFLPDVDLVTHHAPVCLVGVKRSYVLYREVLAPHQDTSFNQAQR